MSVVVLEPSAIPEAIDVLHESFFDYPVMRFVLGSEAHDMGVLPSRLTSGQRPR